MPGHPLFWVVAGQGRSTFFYSEQTRAALANPGRIIDAAERKWPDIVRSLGQ